MFSYPKFYLCFRIGLGTILRIVFQKKERRSGDVGVSQSVLAFQSLIFLYSRLRNVFIFFSWFWSRYVGRFA
jgi:hypothetical protein